MADDIDVPNLDGLVAGLNIPDPKNRPPIERIARSFARAELRLGREAANITDVQRVVQDNFAALGLFPSVALVGSNKQADGTYNLDYSGSTIANEFGEAMDLVQQAATALGHAHRLVTKALYDQKLLTGGGGK